MTAYLVTNPPLRKQFQPRRDKPSGALVIHTAENPADTVSPDFGAENVAKFIKNRTSAGSYHLLVDSDTTIQLVEFDQEAFGEGTGGNRFAIHLSVACRASQWPDLPQWWQDMTITRLASAAALAAAWVYKEHGITIPAERITKFDYFMHRPGIISHAELDPGRRSDPGKDFPWDQFMREFSHWHWSSVKPPPLTPIEDDSVIASLYAAYKSGGRSPSPKELKSWVEYLRGSDDQPNRSPDDWLIDTCLWIADTVSKEGVR